MNKKEVAEIKRRFKKESCTVQRMCGCYVDGEKHKLVQFSQNFLNLEDEEYVVVRQNDILAIVE